jgi:hypothetical protein
VGGRGRSAYEWLAEGRKGRRKILSKMAGKRFGEHSSEMHGLSELPELPELADQQSRKGYY